MTKEQLKIKDRPLTLPMDSKIEIGIANVLDEKKNAAANAHKWFASADKGYERLADLTDVFIKGQAEREEAREKDRHKNKIA